jgi:hypothetical protein
VLDELGVAGGNRFCRRIKTKNVAASQIYRHHDPVLLCCCLRSVVGEIIKGLRRIYSMLRRGFFVGQYFLEHVRSADDVLLSLLSLGCPRTNPSRFFFLDRSD